jgi:hypothetical protein
MLGRQFRGQSDWGLAYAFSPNSAMDIYSYDPMGRTTDFWQCITAPCASPWHAQQAYDVGGDLTSLSFNGAAPGALAEAPSSPHRSAASALCGARAVILRSEAATNLGIAGGGNEGGPSPALRDQDDQRRAQDTKARGWAAGGEIARRAGGEGVL